MFRVILAALFCIANAAACMADATDLSIGQAAAEIDRLLQQSWGRDGITPVPSSSDVEFCRRVWLDLAGVAPPVSEVRRFLDDNVDRKRDLLIDRLLESPAHASHMASRWNEILLPPDSQAQIQQQANVAALHQWLRQQFLDNTPYDHFVGRFLTAGGEGNRGPAIFYTSRSLEPKKVAAATSQVFMGIQLQCAQCHDHPFDRWTQQDFWRYTAFFSQLTQTDTRRGESAIVEDRVGGEVTFPDSETIATPRYPGVSEPPEEDPLGIRRRQLTIWMASRDNPYFARAAVNRAWKHLFGRGLVDPVDQMSEKNKPSHPELLQFLSDYFVQQRFNLRVLYATLARTDAYGRTSLAENTETHPADSFSRMTVKTLTAAQFYDSLQQNVFRASSAIPAATITSATVARNQFLNRMQATHASPSEYPHGVVQVLGLMNGPEVNMATDVNRIGLLASLEAPFLSDADRIETLFLATLSRFPSDAEAARFLEHIETFHSPGGSKNGFVAAIVEFAKIFDRRSGRTKLSASSATFNQAAFADVLWVLLNTAECAVSP